MRDTRTSWTAVLLAGAIVLSLAGGCSATSPAERAPATATATATPPPADPPRPSSAAPQTDTTLPPAPPGAPASFGTGVTAQVIAMRPITAVATAPGDIAGPAVAISLRLVNGLTDAVNVDDVTVTVTDALGAPASPVTGDQAQPFSGSVQPGATQDATYPFRLPADATPGATIVISYRAGVPVATLTL